MCSFVYIEFVHSNDGEGLKASDRAYRALRTDILESRLQPGTLLAEVEQAARLGVSRTPLREALSRLTADGLASPHPGRGIVVTEISLGSISALFEVRIPLDCAAASLAAKRGNEHAFLELAHRFDSASSLIRADTDRRREYYTLVAQFDTAIDAAAGNPYLLQAQRQLRIHLDRIRRLAQDDEPRLLASAAEHAQIARSIAQGNADLAEASTRVHLHNSLQYLLSVRSDEYTTREETIHG